MSAAKRLSIVSDDFGLTAATNEGIALGFASGLLTDTNLMPPCPAFEDAVAICRETGIPVGLHATFTCERTGSRPWGPLTGTPSLKDADGAFPTDPAETWASAAAGEALAEARAQYERLRATAGLPMTHIRQHRNLDADGRCLRTLAALARETGVPYVQPHPALPPGTPHYGWTSLFSLSMVGTDLATRKARLRETLEALAPGHHLWTVHCSSEVPPASGAGDGPFAIWKTYCHLDQLLVTDLDVRRWLDDLGIERVPMARCPVVTAP